MKNLNNIFQALNAHNLKLFFHSLKNESVWITIEKVIKLIKRQKKDRIYQESIKQHQNSSDQLKEITDEIQSFKNKPLITIITPVYNTNPAYLANCIRSVDNQVYPNWEHILIDDFSTADETRAFLKVQEKSKKNNRKLLYMTSNSGISKTSNFGMQHSTGDYVAFLDHDDELHPEALFNVIKSIKSNSQAKLIYTNEDILNKEGLRCQPSAKTHFSIELIRKYNFINHLLVIERETGNNAGWFRPAFDAAQDYDLILRIVDYCKPDDIVFNPSICYHWRKARESIAYSPFNKRLIHQIAKKALEEHLSRNGDVRKVKYAKQWGHFEIAD